MQIENDKYSYKLRKRNSNKHLTCIHFKQTMNGPLRDENTTVVHGKDEIRLKT